MVRRLEERVTGGMVAARRERWGKKKKEEAEDARRRRVTQKGEVKRGLPWEKSDATWEVVGNFSRGEKKTYRGRLVLRGFVGLT